MAKSTSPAPTKGDYEALGRELDHFLVLEYGQVLARRHHRLWHAVLQGFLVGLAGVLGATIGVALLVYTLSQFQNIPLVGHAVHNLARTITINRTPR